MRQALNKTHLSATSPEFAAILQEALAWPLPWTAEQQDRIMAIGPARKLIYSRVNEEETKRRYPIGARARMWNARSKFNNQIGTIAKHYYATSPERGRFIDGVQLRFDDGQEAAPYLTDIRVEPTEAHKPGGQA